MRLELDERAREWLKAHEGEAWAIDYDVHRCCGGGKICEVSVRDLKANDDAAGFVAGSTLDGAQFLIDRRAARRLPRRFTLTVRGAGPLKHLDLDLTGDQWGELLYT